MWTSWAALLPEDDGRSVLKDLSARPGPTLKMSCLPTPQVNGDPKPRVPCRTHGPTDHAPAGTRHADRGGTRGRRERLGALRARPGAGPHRSRSPRPRPRTRTITRASRGPECSGSSTCASGGSGSSLRGSRATPPLPRPSAGSSSASASRATPSSIELAQRFDGADLSATGLIVTDDEFDRAGVRHTGGAPRRARCADRAPARPARPSASRGVEGRARRRALRRGRQTARRRRLLRAGRPGRLPLVGLHDGRPGGGRRRRADRALHAPAARRLDPGGGPVRRAEGGRDAWS